MIVQGQTANRIIRGQVTDSTMHIANNGCHKSATWSLRKKKTTPNLSKTTHVTVHISRASSTLTYMFRRRGNLRILDEQLTI